MYVIIVEPSSRHKGEGGVGSGVSTRSLCPLQVASTVIQERVFIQDDHKQNSCRIMLPAL